MTNDTLDILDQLLAQSEALDRTFRQQFPDLYRDQLDTGRGNQPFPSTDDVDFDDLVPAPSAVPVSDLSDEEPPPPAVLDEDTLQAYLLRRKYQRQDAVSEWESAALASGELVSRIEERPAALADEELFLYAATCLAERQEADAGNALALMLQRSGERADVRFLPLYTSLDSGRSRQQLRHLMNAVRSSHSNDPDQEMLRIAREMVAEVLNIVEQAEALQEKGYRNKQDALRKAQEMSQRRYDRLNSLL